MRILSLICPLIKLNKNRLLTVGVIFFLVICLQNTKFITIFFKKSVRKKRRSGEMSIIFGPTTLRCAVDPQ